MSDLLRDQLEIIGPAAKTIVDVGSHTGESTLEYLENFPQAHLLSFEADATNFTAARTALDKYRNRCSLYHLALADRDGDAQFHVNSHHGTHSLLPLGAVEFMAWPIHEIEKVSVQTRTLDSFATEQAVSNNRYPQNGYPGR